MSFTSKRGPKAKSNAALTVIEGGKTAEQLAELPKKVIRINNEPIDICFAKDLITNEEHWAAIHFRWLYTLRFGAPLVSALNLERINGKENIKNDEKWQEMREREYAMAVEKLRKAGALKTVMNVAVFNIMPKFLINKGSLSKKNINNNYSEFLKLKEGLAALTEMWREISRL